MEVGVKESSKKKLARSIWTGHVGKMGLEKLTENRCTESGGEMDAMKTEIAMGDCLKSDIERVGEK